MAASEIQAAAVASGTRYVDGSIEYVVPPAVVTGRRSRHAYSTIWRMSFHRRRETGWSNFSSSFVVVAGVCVLQ